MKSSWIQLLFYQKSWIWLILAMKTRWIKLMVYEKKLNLADFSYENKGIQLMFYQKKLNFTQENKLNLADILVMKISWIQLIFHPSKQAKFSCFSSYGKKLNSADFLALEKSWIQLIIYQTNGWISNILATKIFWIIFETKFSFLFWVARNCYPISVRKSSGNTNNGCDGPLCQGWDFKFCWWERARRRTIDPFLFKGK